MDLQTQQFFTGFIQDIMTLKILVADYNTSFVNLKAMYGSLTQEQLLEKLGGQEKQGVLTLLNNLRRVAFSLNTDIESLKSELMLSDEDETKLSQGFEEIETKVLFDYKKVKDFVQILNNIKIKNINVQAAIINPEKEKRAYESMQTPRVD